DAGCLLPHSMRHRRYVRSIVGTDLLRGSPYRAGCSVVFRQPPGPVHRVPDFVAPVCIGAHTGNRVAPRRIALFSGGVAPVFLRRYVDPAVPAAGKTDPIESGASGSQWNPWCVPETPPARLHSRLL